MDFIVDPVLDRHDWGYVVRRKWKLLVLFPFLGVAAAVGFYATRTPLFESEAVILVDPSYDRIIQLENVGDGHRSDLEAIKSLETAIVADSVLIRVLRRLDLREEEGFLPDDLRVPGTPELKIVDFLKKNRIKVALLPETRLIQIQTFDPSPERARRITELLSSEFETFLWEQREKEIERGRSRLEARAEGARQKALESEKELAAFRERNAGIPVEQEHTLFAEQLTQFGTQFNESRGRRMALESKKNALEALSPEGAAMEIIEIAEYANMPHVSTLLDAIVVSRTRLSAIREEYTEAHPSSRAAEAELARNEAELRALAAKIKSAVTANFLAEKSREESLAGELESAKSKFMEMKKISSDYRALVQQTEKDWSVFETLQTKLGESAVSSELTSQIATVVSEPMVPYEKAKPSLPLFVLIGGGLGSLVSGGALLALLVSGLPFSNRRQVEERFGLPVIADWSGPKHTSLSPGLLQFLDGNRGKAVQISAPQLNGAGGTVARGMGTAAAGNALKSLLVTVRPGESDMEIRPTDCAGLFEVSLNPGPALANGEFSGWLRQMRGDFDLILIDAGKTGDPELTEFLSSQADRDVVVIGKDRSKKSLVEDWVNRLSRSPDRQVGFVVVNGR